MAEHSRGFMQFLYAEPETAGYGVSPVPAGTAFRLRDATFTVREERRTRQDRKYHRAAEDRIRGKRHVEWTVTLSDAPALVSGYLGPLPHVDLAPLYGVTFASHYTQLTAVLAAGERNAQAPTPTSCDVPCSSSPAAPAQAGDVIGISVAEGFFAVAVQTATFFADDQRLRLTWHPSLPRAPEAGTAISVSLIYQTRNEPAGSVTLHRCLDNHSECIAGAVPDTYLFTLSGADEATVEVHGLAQDLARFGPMTLREAVQTLDLTLPVEELRAAILRNGVALYRLGRESRYELVEVNGTVPANQDGGPAVQVQRGANGTTPLSHSAGDPLALYWTPPAIHGEAVAGILGRLYLDGQSFEITRARLTVKENAKLRQETYGAAVAAGYLYPQARAVSVILDGFLKSGEAPWVKAAGKETMPLVMQAGTELGRTHAFFLPRVEFEIPSIEAPADAEIPLSLTGVALAQNAYGVGLDLVHAFL